MAETLPESVRVARKGKDSQARARLVLVYPPELKTTFPLTTEPVEIGRRPEGLNRFRIAAPTMSRRHFVIEFESAKGQHVGWDLGSRQRSTVNGRAIGEQHTALEHGDLLRLGKVLMIYEQLPSGSLEDDADVSKDAIFGNSTAVQAVRQALGQAARDPSPVLIVGETGTGKEYVARELHRLSQRSGSLLSINCAALSPQLIESQLFGHARGAFTGAQSASEGLFRAADKGSLFLDEVGELPLELQPKLLRVLQEGEVLPVGETRSIAVDVRVIAATLHDLQMLAQQGTFRLDLYARMAMWEVRVPALRKRRVDLLDWVERIATRWHAERDSKQPEPLSFTADAAEALLLHDWPDNLRGVVRLVHRLCASQTNEPIDVDGIETFVSQPADSLRRVPWTSPAVSDVTPAPARVVDADEVGSRPSPSEPEPARIAEERPSQPRPPKPTREQLMEVLEQTGGSVRATAKIFQRSRRQISRWLEQHGLRAKK